MVDGRLVGVAMQRLTGAQNTSSVLPAPLVERFLADLQDGRYDGVPQLGVTFQPLENRAMRRRYGVESETGGVLLREVVPGSGAASVLRPDDVLLAIDGTPIAEDGTIEFRLTLPYICTFGQEWRDSGRRAERAGDCERTRCGCSTVRRCTPPAARLA